VLTGASATPSSVLVCASQSMIRRRIILSLALPEHWQLSAGLVPLAAVAQTTAVVPWQRTSCWSRLGWWVTMISELHAVGVAIVVVAACFVLVYGAPSLVATVLL